MLLTSKTSLTAESIEQFQLVSCCRIQNTDSEAIAGGYAHFELALSYLGAFLVNLALPLTNSTGFCFLKPATDLLSVGPTYGKCENGLYLRSAAEMKQACSVANLTCPSVGFLASLFPA